MLSPVFAWLIHGSCVEDCDYWSSHISFVSLLIQELSWLVDILKSLVKAVKKGSFDCFSVSYVLGPEFSL